MVIDYEHGLPLDEAKERLIVLGEYLYNRHGIDVAWNGDHSSATFKGKYMVVNIEGDLTVENGAIHFRGKDPGFLWRKKAVKYLEGKLEAYLDPGTPVAELPRDKK